MLHHVIPFLVLMASFLVWSERNRLRLTETPDRIILYIHVRASRPLYSFTSSFKSIWDVGVVNL